jgi:tetratricopeptide (TPR) repeat protein
LKCELLLRRDRGDDAEKVLASALARFSGGDQDAVRYRLALVHLYRGKRDEARRELIGVSEIVTADVRPVQLLTELALETGDWAEAQRQEERLKELEKIDGQTGWQFYQAQRLIGEGVQQKDFAARDRLINEARALQSRLEHLRPFWAPTYLLKGRLAQLGLKPDEDAAIEAFFEALRLGERRVQLYQELISLLFRRHRITEAAAIIDRIREADDVPQELVSLAVAADVSQGNVARAVRLAAAEVRRNPDDSFSHLRLGQLLALNLPTDASARKAKLDEAESELKRSQELAPRDSRVWSALLAFYHTTGQTDLARQTLIQVANDDFLDAKDMPFFLAQGYALIGDNDEARKLYLEAVEANPDRLSVLVQAGDFFFRSEPDRAERYLRHAVELAPGEPTASRKLAALIAVRSTSEKEMDEVWQLLNASSSQGMPDVADERLRAVLLLRRGGSRSRKQAQQVLESLVAGGSFAPLDRLLLARLYEAQGEIEKAREQLEALVQKSQPDPAHLAAYADHLLRTANKNAPASKRLSQIINQLASLEPETKSFRTLGLRARWLKLVNRGSEVSTLVDKFLAQPLPASDVPRQAQRLLLVAGLYETLDFQSQCESCYRRAVELSPGAFRPLATWLARHDRAAEAIELCRQAAVEDKSAAPAVALAAVLTVGSVTPQERTAAEPFLNKSLSEYPDDRALLFGVATLRLMQHDNDDAERLLRRFLRLEPRNVPAMNNLAMLLAEQHNGASEALELVDRAVAIAGAQSELFDTKGWVMLEQKKFPEAESNFREALAMPPDSPRYRFHLALSYQRQGKEDDARAMLQRALADDLTSELLSPKERDELRKLESIGK